MFKWNDCYYGVIYFLFIIQHHFLSLKNKLTDSIINQGIKYSIYTRETIHVVIILVIMPECSIHTSFAESIVQVSPFTSCCELERKRERPFSGSVHRCHHNKIACAGLQGPYSVGCFVLPADSHIMLKLRRVIPRDWNGVTDDRSVGIHAA